MRFQIKQLWIKNRFQQQQTEVVPLGYYSPLIEGGQAAGKARSQRFALVVVVEGKQTR